MVIRIDVRIWINWVDRLVVNFDMNLVNVSCLLL